MNNYVTGETIKRLRTARRMTQDQLAQQLGVTGKAVSKWETARGLPDVALLEPLAKALRISVPELLSGEQVVNSNRAANILRSPLYVCPVCGNIIHSSGPAVASCCGLTLPPLEAEEPDEAHKLVRERFDLVKLYPEGLPEARFEPRSGGYLYWYCNRHGLFREKL